MKRNMLFKISLLGIFLLLSQGCNSTHQSPTSNIISNGKSTPCDTILDKKYYNICYDDDLKGALFVSYKLSADKVNTSNITKRPSFYEDKTLPKEYISRSSDYIGSGYDRGHLASDASFDYSADALKSVYVMSNIVPQYPSLNRYAWSDTEDEERRLAKKYGEVGVIIGVVYDDNPQRIGADFIAVPAAFYKTIYTTDGHQVCYYYENIPIDTTVDELSDHQVDCATLTLQYY